MRLCGCYRNADLPAGFSISLCESKIGNGCLDQLRGILGGKATPLTRKPSPNEVLGVSTAHFHQPDQVGIFHLFIGIRGERRSNKRRMPKRRGGRRTAIRANSNRHVGGDTRQTQRSPSILRLLEWRRKWRVSELTTRQRTAPKFMADCFRSPPQEEAH